LQKSILKGTKGKGTRQSIQRLDTRQGDRRFKLKSNLDEVQLLIVRDAFWNVLRCSGQKGVYSTGR